MRYLSAVLLAFTLLFVGCDTTGSNLQTDVDNQGQVAAVLSANQVRLTGAVFEETKDATRLERAEPPHVVPEGGLEITESENLGQGIAIITLSGEHTGDETGGEVKLAR